MSVEVVSEIWSQLKRYISSVDRGDAAEEMVSILIDHDYSADEIRDEFSDAHVKTALAPYFDHRRDEESDFEDDDEDSDYYDYDDEEDEDY